MQRDVYIYIHIQCLYTNIPQSWFQNAPSQPQLWGVSMKKLPPKKNASKPTFSQVRLYAPEFFQTTNKFQVILDVLPHLSSDS